MTVGELRAAIVAWELGDDDPVVIRIDLGSDATFNVDSVGWKDNPLAGEPGEPDGWVIITAAGSCPPNNPGGPS